MATKNPGIAFSLKLLGWREFADGAKQGGKAVSTLGSEAEVAGRKAQQSQRGFGIFQREVHRSKKTAREAEHSFGGLSKKLVGLGLGFTGYEQIKESTEAVSQLGKSAINLHAVQGLSLNDALNTSAVMQAAGLRTASVSQAYIALARASGQAGIASHRRMLQERASNGQLSATSKMLSNQEWAFRRLGISQKDIAGTSGNLQELFKLVTQRLSDMKGGADKTRAATYLLGRGAKSLSPLLKDGAEGFNAQLTAAGKYMKGLGLSEEQLKHFEIAERNSQYATLALQVTIGEYLMPALIKLMNIWPKLVQNVRKGNGAWGTVHDVIAAVVAPTRAVVGWFSKSKTATEVLVVALTALGGAFAIQKVINMTKAIKGLWLMEQVAAGASWAWRTALGREAAVAATGAAEVTAAKYGEQLAIDMPGALAKTGESSGLRAAFRRLGMVSGGWLAGGLAAVAVAAIGLAIYKHRKQIGKWVKRAVGDESSNLHNPLIRNRTPTLGQVNAAVTGRPYGAYIGPHDTHFEPGGGAHPQAGQAPRGQVGKPGTIPFFARYGSRKRIMDYARTASPANLAWLEKELRHFHRPFDVGAAGRTSAPSGRSGDLHVHVNADGKQIAKVVVPHFRDARIRGKVGSAAVSGDLDVAAFGG